MYKKDFIDKIVNETSENKKTVEEIFNVIFSNLEVTIKNDKKVLIPGFGTFKLTERKERLGINPRTKERITINASKSVSFKPAKNFKENLK